MSVIDAFAIANSIARVYPVPLGTSTGSVRISVDFIPAIASGDGTSNTNWLVLDSGDLSSGGPLVVNENIQTASRRVIQLSGGSWLSQINLFVNDIDNLPSNLLSTFTFNFVLAFTPL